MVSQIKERTIEEIKAKLENMNTELNKLSYLEIALREAGLSYEIKRFLLEEAASLYEIRKMHEKAAKAMATKASIDVTTKDKIEAYLKAAEMYSKAGKIDFAEEIFLRASREANNEQRAKIGLAKKNIYSRFAKELETQGKKASALKFYEKLIKMEIDPLEKQIIKKRLTEIYKGLGMFREAKFLEGF